MSFIRSFILLAAIVLLPALAAPLAAEEPGKIEVHDLSLWILDPGQSQANARAAYPSALPVTVNTTRMTTGTPEARRVAPIGLVTFHGAPAANLDVDLRTKSGSFIAHWPAGDSLPNRLRWAGSMPSYDLVEKVDESDLMFVDADHWVNAARTNPALYMKRGARSERFLAYDMELNLQAPVKLEGGPDKYRVINLTGTPLYDVLISRSTPEGRRVAWIDVLPKGESVAPEQNPAPKPAPGNKPADNLFSDAPAGGAAPAGQVAAVVRNAQLQIEAQVAVAREKVAAARAAQLAAAKPKVVGDFAAAPAEAPAVAPAAADAKPAEKPADAKPGGLFGGIVKLPETSKQGVEVTLSEPVGTDPAEAAAQTLDPLKQRLLKTGLTEEEVQQFVDHYGSLFFSGEALVVACRLDPAAMEEKVPLSVFPLPKKTVRVAMVLARNADPALGQEVDNLIAQLGDAKFAVREAAHKRLATLGPLAVPALNKALNHNDLEIVIRAERLLLNQNQTPNANAGAAGGLMINGNIQLAPAVIAR